MRAAFVVQRYGADIIGGAETHARWLAEKLSKEKGWQIDVYTTTARDYQSWADVLPAGESREGPVRILRFKPLCRRRRFLFGLLNRMLGPLLVRTGRQQRGDRREAGSGLLARMVSWLEHLWVLSQGPWVPSLVRELHLNQHMYEKIYFFTWLYYPARVGVRGLKEKSVLIPTAHDENPFWFPGTARVFRSFSKILVNSPAEKALIRSLPGCQTLDIEQAGVVPWISEPSGQAPLRRGWSSESFGLYLCFLGRLSRGKGIEQLCQYFLNAEKHHPDQDISLVLAGAMEGDLSLPQDKSVIHCGRVSEDEKAFLLSRALAIVNPSPRESLSLLSLEALLLRKPLLVNAANPVLKRYADEIPSVRGFVDEDSFSEGLLWFQSAEWLQQRDEALEEGYRWAQKEYNWERILAVFAGSAKL